MMRIAFLLVPLLLTSCDTLHDMQQAPPESTVSIIENSSIDASQSPTVFLRIDKDNGHFAENISQRIEALGFKMTPAAGPSDYYADVHYKTYFDVVHNTFVYFDIAFVDAKTETVKLRLHYDGGLGGFNGCNKALSLLFHEAAQHLKKGT